MERVDSLMESLARALNYVGERAEELFPRRFGPLPTDHIDPVSGLVASSRRFEERYPVGRTPAVFIVSEFGEVRVGTWDNQVVLVTADIEVRAETNELAGEIARGIEVGVDAAAESLSIVTRCPDTRGIGLWSIEVNYDLTIPRNASLNGENFFGDTLVEGAGGPLTLKSRFGQIALTDVGGAVTVEAHGEYPLIVDGLAQGGAFDLNGTQAEFHNAAGRLRVRNSMGSTGIHDLPPETDVDVVSQSGRIDLYLPATAAPDIAASALFGQLKSDIPLDKTSRGNLVFGRKAKVEARQRIGLHATFSDVTIHAEGAEQKSDVNPLPQGELITEAVSLSEKVEEGTPILIDATIGDIHVAGHDSAEIKVQARRLVRVAYTGNADDCLAALDVQTTADEEGLAIRTKPIRDMAALGCMYYRVDLDIAVPNVSPLRIVSRNGHTSITATGESIEVDQQEGTIAVEHCKGTLTLTNHRGDVTVTDCAGPLTATGDYGSISSRNIFSDQTIACNQGKVVIDAPQSSVKIDGAGSDIRIIALDGIRGSFEVRAEHGDIAMLVPETSDVMFFVTVENGAVDSKFELSGTNQRNIQRYQRRLNEGTHRVELEARDGSITIN
jgi:hypothetical protein